jgi:hypothetical protein
VPAKFRELRAQADSETQGCLLAVGCAVVAFLVVVDYLPLQTLLGAFWGTSHDVLTSAVASLLVLVSAPLVAVAALYLLMRLRERIRSGAGDWFTAENSQAALSPDELAFVLAVLIGLGAGIAWGVVLVALLDRVLP